jgi:hypothetical protein
MTNNYFNSLQNKVLSSTSFVFEPSINVFKNGIVINYQKVGTRFIQEIASGNTQLANEDNKQVQFIISAFPPCDENQNPLNYIEFEFVKKYVRAPWKEGGRKYLMDTYRDWHDDESFLKSQGYENYTDFFLNNKNDIIFIIRNPIHRFFSGIVQILTFSNEKLTIESFGKLLRNNWENIISDIHTINYLQHYKDLIYNIKDKSKIKIIDLSHLKSQKACDFFCSLRGDDVIREIYKNIDSSIDSNKDEYTKFYKLYENIDENESIFIQHIKAEYNNYLELKSSKYFMNLL